MNFGLFIAKRIATNRQYAFSGFIIKLSIAATALSVAAMIITLCFVNGFQKTVSNKVYHFWGHARLQTYENTKALVATETVIEKNTAIVSMLQKNNAVAHVNSFATTSAILEKNKEIEGVLLKGIDNKYDSSLIKAFIKKGRFIQFSASGYSKEIMLSEQTANLLLLKVGDSLNIHTLEQDSTGVNSRKVYVAGIYKTGIVEFDKLFAVGDIGLVRKLVNWQENQIGGYEVFLKDNTNHEKFIASVNEELPINWGCQSIENIYPNIFDWLNIQNMNRNVVFIIMGIVAVINLITCLLILVLERTKMVGLLKAVGTNNWQIQKIFLLQAAWIAIKGIGLGLLIGLGICLLQQQFGLIKLDEANYYVSTAPVDIIAWQIALVCIAAVFTCFIAMLLPSLFVRNIQPVKSLQFR